LAHNRELLKDTEIRAQFSGNTSERHVSVGDFLRVGDPIVRLVQLNPLEVSFRVDESYKSKLYPSQPVTVKVSAFPDKEFRGEVFFVSPDLDIDTRSFLVKSRIANEDHLLNPGMFAEITMVTETHRDAVVVPWESVIQLENEVYVYVLNTDTARKVPVRLGLISGGIAEIFGELKPGQLVVKDGKYSLHEGKKVKIQESKESS
jgi:RND family efflux transporter MFP subunit